MAIRLFVLILEERRSKGDLGVTPEAVIYRYLQAADVEPCDVARVVTVIGCDADLLGRWLNLLRCPATPDDLTAALSALDLDTFRHLALAQAWSVLPTSGSARLSLDQWQAVLRAGCLAEVLAESLQGDGDAAGNQAVRWRVLLAISGVNLPHDPAMAELNAFRGTRPELLEDVNVLLRVFSVVDAVEVLSDSEAAELANQLLGISAQTFADAFSQADHRSRTLLAELDLAEERETDWADRLWIHQQVSMLGAFLGQADSDEELLAAHTFAARCLFNAEPYLLQLESDRQTLTSIEHDGLGIPVSSATSSIATSVREDSIEMLADAADQAVVDRQVLRRMAVEEAVCLPLQLGGRALGAAVFPINEDVDDEFAMTQYAKELSRRLNDVGSDRSDTHELLKRYRNREEKRLRELVHEANNPLSIVHNYLHILELRLQHEPSATEQIDMIGKELKRATEIIQRVRELPSLDEVDEQAGTVFEAFDVNDLGRRVLELHRGYADEHDVELRAEFAPGALMASSDEQRLAQILNNLMRNAIESSPGEGVSMGSYAGVYREGKEGVEVFVSDTGPGLPRSVLESLAERKVSSKGGDHAGLGLHIVYRLVAELQGGIDVRTSAGQGTRFTVFLPLGPP